MNKPPTTLDHVPYATLDRWWSALIEDGRFHCTQDALPIFPLDHLDTATPATRYRVVIEWRENGIKKRLETRAGDISIAMADMWRLWISESRIPL